MYAEVFGMNVPLTQSQPTESTQGTYRIPSAPRSTRLTPLTLVPTVDKADEMILQDRLQVSLAEHKSREEQEARENVELVNEHLASMKIEKIVEGQENVIEDSSISRNDELNTLGTRLEPRSDKGSPKVEFTDVVIPVNVNEEEEEITDEVYELKQREKGKIVEEFRKTPFPTPIRSPRIYTDLVSLDTEKLQELTELQGRYGYLFKHLRARFMPRKSFATLADHIQEVPQTTCRTSVVRLRDLDDPYDDAHPEEGNSAKRQKTSEYEAYVSGESSSGQDNEKEQDDDEIPTKQVSHDIMEEVSLTIDKAKLKKIADAMLRQRCNSGDEHQYHID
nr:hypothetical protein [Tanacetum cinerariifolium]